MRRLITLPALTAAVAVLLATGCERGKTGNTPPPGTSPAASKDSAGFTVPSVPNLATPQTAGKPTFQLKLGQPASFLKDGITITVVPKSLEPVEGTPAGLESDADNCGSWWKLTEEITVDAQPDSTWKGWYAQFNSPSVLISMRKLSARYGDIYYSSSDANADDSKSKFLVRAANDFENSPKAAFHRSKTIVEYPATCVYDSKADKHVPSGKPPVGLVWNQKLDKAQDAAQRPDVAVWVL